MQVPAADNLRLQHLQQIFGGHFGYRFDAGNACGVHYSTEHMLARFQLCGELGHCSGIGQVRGHHFDRRSGGLQVLDRLSCGSVGWTTSAGQDYVPCASPDKPLSDVSTETAGTSGDQIGAVRTDSDLPRFLIMRLQPRNETIGPPQGDLILRCGRSEFRGKRIDLFCAAPLQIHHPAPELRVFEGDDFPETPDCRLSRVEGILSSHRLPASRDHPNTGAI